MSKVIGIDLGTTNSVVCVMEDGEPKVIANEEGGRTTPSVVAIEQNGNVLVGQHARRQAITNPQNTVFSAKRFIGRRWSEVQDELPRVPFEAGKAKNDGVEFTLQGKRWSPEEISARVLGKLKKAAEDYLGEPVKKAVITVPAYFNDSQRQATKDAGRIAGLDVERIVNEPTAAALAFAHAKKGDAKSQNERVVAVYDLGGGTFDISILEVAQDVVEVLSTGGDTHLGGDDFDQRVVEWLLAEFKRDSGIDLAKDKLVMQRLRDAAERAKIELSQQPETEINLPFLTADATGPKHLQIKLSRAKFEGMIADLVERTIGPCKRALADAKKKVGDIDEVLLVGGSSRVPLVQQKVEALFGKAPNKGVNPDEVVGLGAAVQAGVLAGDVKDMVLVDVTPLSLGIETLGGVMTVLIPRNTTIPTRRSEVFTTAADDQPSVEVHVVQGERKMAGDNRTLAKFGLNGLPAAPRGLPQIEVTFDIDANGIVNVSAKDKATNREQKVTVTAGSGLTDADIQRMVDEAAKHSADDDRRREAAESRNALEALTLQADKLLAESGSKLDATQRNEVETAIADAKSMLDSGDAPKLIAARERLTKALHAVSQTLYGGTAQAANASREDEPADVIDADFEEKAS
jgi:molecular chaperone DnaK